MIKARIAGLSWMVARGSIILASSTDSTAFRSWLISTAIRAGALSRSQPSTTIHPFSWLTVSAPPKKRPLPLPVLPLKLKTQQSQWFFFQSFQPIHQTALLFCAPACCILYKHGSMRASLGIARRFSGSSLLQSPQIRSPLAYSSKKH